MSFRNAGNVWVWECMGLYGRTGGHVRVNAPHLAEADAWIARYGTRQPVPVASPATPAAAPKPACEVGAAPAPAPAAPVAKPAPVLPPRPPALDLHAVKAALALVATCRDAADLDAAAELFNADWPEGWPRSVEMVWDRAFKQAA